MASTNPTVGAAPRRKRRWLKWTALIATGLALSVGVWAYRVARSFTGKGDSIADVWRGITNPRALFPDKDRIVILIVGKDYDHDVHDMPSTANSRSDTVMLLSADLANKKLGAVSIPRDTRVIGPDGKTHKINAMLPAGGVDLLEKTIAKEYGITPDYHVVLKDLAVKNIVDAVGGVDVDVLDDMFYQDSWGSLYIDLHKGHQHLNGDQAIGYVRFRKTGDHKIVDGKPVPIPHKSSLEEGDIRRTERQQALLRSLMAQAMTPSNLLHADSIVDVGFSQIDTNLKRPQCLALATLFRGQSVGSSPTATIPGSDSTDDGVYYFVPDNARTRLTMQWLMNGDEAAGRKLVRVVIYNGSGTSGLSRQAADSVLALGFTGINGGTMKASQPRSSVIYRKAVDEAFAREVASKLGIADVQKDTGDPRAEWRPEVKVVLGSDSVASMPKQMR